MWVRSQDIRREDVGRWIVGADAVEVPSASLQEPARWQAIGYLAVWPNGAAGNRSAFVLSESFKPRPCAKATLYSRRRHESPSPPVGFCPFIDGLAPVSVSSRSAKCHPTLRRRNTSERMPASKAS